MVRGDRKQLSLTAKDGNKIRIFDPASPKSGTGSASSFPERRKKVISDTLWPILCQKTSTLEQDCPICSGGLDLVPHIHNRQILDVFEVLDRDTGLDPAGPAVSKVVPPIRTFVDGVGSVGIVGLDNLPGPRPGEIGKVALLLRVLVAVHRIERRENRIVFLHG